MGALIAPFVVAILCNGLFATKGIDANGKEIIMSYGYKYGFLAAAIGMGIGQILFNLLSKKYLLEIGTKPSKESRKPKTELVDGVQKNIVKTPLTTIEKQRITVIVILTFFVIFFWAGFEQAGSSMTLYTDKYINRNFLGWNIPTELFQSVNPFWLQLPLFCWVWLMIAFN